MPNFYVPVVLVVSAEDKDLAQAQSLGFLDSLTLRRSPDILGYSLLPSLSPSLASNSWKDIHLSIATTADSTSTTNTNSVEELPESYRLETKSVMHPYWD